MLHYVWRGRITQTTALFVPHLVLSADRGQKLSSHCLPLALESWVVGRQRSSTEEQNQSTWTDVHTNLCDLETLNLFLVI